ncbi:cuticle protein-like [Anopheles darlingi]|uniref:cuticle protein-like n=1 Tax=Anopheles darlingi TaxID=43151 RepID=UPI0021002328|nr:cuticle protein-like [Anopheles darlingi]
MAFKFVTFAALVAVARAGLIASPAVSYQAAPALAPIAKVAYAAAPVAYAAAPIAKVAYAPQHDEYDPNPQYSYSYGISDALTGDSKSQQESRSGDVVQGSYSLIDADGFKRTVEYTADPHHGFNAVVRREPLAAKTVVAAAPVATKVIAQPALAYAAPVAKTISYAAPVATKTVIAQPTLAYAAPVAKTYVSSPAISYAAPVAKTISYAAPVAKTYVSSPAVSYAAPLQYSAPLATKTIVSSPAVSYAAPAYASYH